MNLPASRVTKWIATLGLALAVFCLTFAAPAADAVSTNSPPVIQGHNIVANNGNGQSRNSTLTVNVAPTVAISGAPKTSTPLTPITLASIVTDPGADTFTYSWVATKGIVAFSSGTSAAFTFVPDTEGTYSVSLTVADKNGATARAFVSILADVVPQFISAPVGNPNPAVINAAVNFSVTLNPADALIAWDFGDGSAAVLGATPTHVYTSPGAYTVNLLARNPRSGSMTRTSCVVTCTEPTSIAMLKLLSSLVFTPSGDGATITATLPLTAAQLYAPKTVTVHLGTFSQTFKCDAHGRAYTTDQSGQCRLTIPKGKIPLAQITYKISRSSIRSALSTTTNLDAFGNPATAAISLDFGGQSYGGTFPIAYYSVNPNATVGKISIGQ